MKNERRLVLHKVIPTNIDQVVDVFTFLVTNAAEVGVIK